MPAMMHDRRLGFRGAADRGAVTGPAHLVHRRDVTPSTNHPDSSESTTNAGGSEVKRTAKVPQTQHNERIHDHPCATDC